MRCSLMVLVLIAVAGSAQAARWSPPLLSSFDIQLNDPGASAQVPDVSMVELDHDIDPALLKQVQARGIKTVCYFNAGAWEAYRSDADKFPLDLLGKHYDGYPQERWLDIRALDLLAPFMRARLDQCKAKGFVAVDPDNVDGFENATGFELTAEDQLKYNHWLAKEAHARGLAIALKNAPSLASALTADFDFIVSESCFAQDFCEEYTEFLLLKKPVYDLEYKDEGMTLEDFCGNATQLGINAILKRSSSSVDAYRATCPDAP